MPHMVSFPSFRSSSGTNGPGLGLVSTPGIGFWGAVSLVSAIASARHGYLRHRGSTPWALGWGVLGLFFPIVTPAWAVFVQGYGKPER